MRKGPEGSLFLEQRVPRPLVILFDLIALRANADPAHDAVQRRRGRAAGLGYQRGASCVRSGLMLWSRDGTLATNLTHSAYSSDPPRQ